MMACLFPLLLVLAALQPGTSDEGFSLAPVRQDAHPDVLSIAADLEHQTIAAGEPRPGVVAWDRLPDSIGTEVAHTVYLPPGWTPGRSYPVIVEYLGNTARVRDLRAIGYPLCAKAEMIWVVLPFVAAGRTADTPTWWGDVDATVEYAKQAVPAVCARWGGDPKRVVLAGSSRGAIACNYIGLHDDEIATLWQAMIIVSHYDDMHIPWGMSPEEQRRAPERVKRLGRVPQLIVGEHTVLPQPWGDTSLRGRIERDRLTTFAAAKQALGLKPMLEVEKTRRFLREHHPNGDYTFIDLPWVNHESAAFLRDTPERETMRRWLEAVVSERQRP